MILVLNESAGIVIIQNMGRDTCNSSILFNVLYNNGARPNGCIVPDFDVFNQAAHRPDINTISDNGRSVVVCSDIEELTEIDIISNYGSSIDGDTVGMAKIQSIANIGIQRYLNPIA